MVTCGSYNDALVTILCKSVFGQPAEVGDQNDNLMLFHCTYFQSGLRVLLPVLSLCGLCVFESAPGFLVLTDPQYYKGWRL